MAERYGPGAWSTRLAHGAHIGALFAGCAQRDDLIRSFLAEGLADGDKCVCVADAEDPAMIMEPAGVDVGACLAARRLEQIPSREAYLTRGIFIAAETFAVWRTVFGEASGGIRLAVEIAPGVCGEDNRGELFRAELAYNQVFGGYQLRTLCLYDVDHVDAAIFLTVLRTHPQLLIDGELIDNGHYVGLS